MPKALFPDADPVRSCESLRSVVLPNTTIDAAAIEPGRPSSIATASMVHVGQDNRAQALARAHRVGVGEERLRH